MEREAQEFLSEMDSLLAVARERLQKRSNRQLPPAAGVSNLSTISFRSSDQQHQLPQQQHLQQLTSQDTELLSMQSGPVSQSSMHNDSRQRDTEIERGRSLEGDRSDAASATKPTRPLIPAIFNTALTSSSDESEDDADVDLAVTGRKIAAGATQPSETAESTSPNPGPAVPTQALEGTRMRKAPGQQHLTGASAGKVASTAADEPEQAINSDGDQMVHAADEAETIRLEVAALASKRSPEQAKSDRSAPQIERTVHVGYVPEALAFFDFKLKSLFERFGKVISVTSHHRTVHHNRDTHHQRSKNWALVSFADALSAREAVRRGVEVHDKDDDDALCKLLVRNLDADQDLDALHIHHQQHLAKTDAQDDLGWLG